MLIKMAGVTLATSLYLAEGSLAQADLGVEDMELRIRSQVCTSRLYLVSRALFAM